jgi:hypothetical protein
VCVLIKACVVQSGGIVELGMLTAATDVTQFAVLLVNRSLTYEAFRPGHVEEAELETENAPSLVYAARSGDIAEAVLHIAPAHQSHVGEGSLAAASALILPFAAHRMASVGLDQLTVVRPPRQMPIPLASPPANQRSVQPVGRLHRLLK